MNNTSWLALIDRLNAAPFQIDGWQSALSDIANATQSRAAHLVGLSGNTEPFFNCIADPEPEWVEDFLAAGGKQPGSNPRIEAGLAIPVLETFTDEAIVTRKERPRHEFYSELLPRSRTAYFCGSNLIQDPGMTVGMAVLRRPKEGEITEPQHQLFKSLLPHARTAFRTQILLRDHGASLLAGRLGALNLSVFICDRLGKVEAMTPSAEALVSGTGPLQLRAGLLSARYPPVQLPLSTRIRAIANRIASKSAATSESLVIRNHAGFPLVLEVVQLPVLECQLNFQPRALVLVRDRQPDPEVVRQILAAAYSLTEAESAIAMLLSNGLSPDAIAVCRQVSSGTVRMQLKSLFSKVDVHSQVELLARLRPLL